MKFRRLGIIEPILKVIKTERFEEPTEIQSKAIPLVIKGKDVIAGSATGSGKTLVFGSGIIQNCEKGSGLQTLILTPTRELAEQVSRALRKFSKYKPLSIIAVYGGVAIGPQIDRLKRADVVVGTPGRILDHLERRTIDLRKIKILVLDEADRMLDMGFIDDVKKIISQCSKKRQTLLFSATITHEIDYLIKRHMKNPIKVSAESYVDPRKLKQAYYDVMDNLKFSLLVHLLKKERKGLVMVFCNTRQNVDFVARNLKSNGIDSVPIHGGFTQAKRSYTMERFHSQKAQILICTDVAARGLDIPFVSHIYNYDIPKDSKEYIHRIGRTARAGKEGMVVNVLSSRDHDNFSRVLRDYDVNVVKEKTPFIEKVKFSRERFGRDHGRSPRRGHGGGPRRGYSGGPRRDHGRAPRSGGQQRSHSGRSNAQPGRSGGSRYHSKSRHPRRSSSRSSGPKRYNI